MCFLFAMISFVTNLAAPIGTIWGYQYEGNSVLGMMGNMMNFLAYLFMGIPAGKLLQKIGYKKTALWAMAVGVAGLLIQWISSLQPGDMNFNFVIYLLGAFVCGFCVCMLNTVVNPMLNLLGGGGNRGNQLLQIGNSFNSLTGTLTPLFVGMLVGELTDSTSMTTVEPLLWIAIGVFVASFIVISFVTIPEPGISKGKVMPRYTHSPWNFRHTVLGVIGIFIYVGIEVGIPGTLNFYLSDQGPTGAGVEGAASAIAGAIVAVYWLLMLCGRLLSSVISAVVSSKTQLIVVSSLAMLLVVAAILIPSSCTLPVPEFLYSGARVPVSAYLLIICGLCTSVMWGGIFNLAVEGLGKYTAQASGIFMMMVVGGGVIPLVQQVIAKNVGYMASYWLIAICLGYLLFYGLVGSKNVNTDIPVTEEEDAEEIANAI
ncbi:MAG: MFS transporter [Muribaculaceae bacterium]|nr:MFS transporter [Muribaculaceae bacterium]